MISSFHIPQLQNLLRDFYTLTQIRITVFDEQMEELASYPQERADFCQLIRADPKALERCLSCDREALAAARKSRAPYIYRCHAGLTEAVAPIYFGGLIAGYLFFGHVFCYQNHPAGWEEIRARCGGYSLELDSLREACFQLPVKSQEYILSASHILEAVASYLCLEQMATLKRDSLPVRIDRYIADHLAEKLSAAVLCREFHIGKTALYEIANQSYGMGIAEHIRTMRIDRAKAMLAEQPMLSIGAIASRCGFGDYNYFFSVFKRMTGQSPRAYRNQALNAAPLIPE